MGCRSRNKRRCSGSTRKGPNSSKYLTGLSIAALKN
jgi:hypothetical protein